MKNTRYKILLIEDDKLDQMAFKRAIEEQNLAYDCTIAGSVSQAQSILATEQFDIIIADYILGDGTGFDILDLVKNTPFILVTGAGDEETAVKVWRAGAYDYLIKDPERNYLKALPITVENAVRHKKTEAKLQLLSGAVTSTDDSVYITDMDNKIIFVNKAFCKTYGYTEQEIIGKDSNILWIAKPQSENTRSVFRLVRSAWEVGFYHKRKNGSVFPVSLSRSIIKDSNGNEIAVVGIARNISERILVEDELRTENLQLKEQNRLKSELAVIVCRQLTPLVDRLKNIISSARAGALGQIDSKLSENLQLVQNNIDKAKSIIAEFTDISEIDAGRMTFKRSEFSFQSVVSQVLKALSPLAAEKGIELESFMPDADLVVDADRDRMVQVLTNIIGGSINSVPANGHIDVQVKDVSSDIIVEVQDDGPGIESGGMDKIFNYFDQIRMKIRSGKEEDLDLGLPIAKELMEMQGGCIWAESKDGEGSNICLTLPKARVPEGVPVGVRTGENDYGNRTRQ